MIVASVEIIFPFSSHRKYRTSHADLFVCGDTFASPDFYSKRDKKKRRSLDSYSSEVRDGKSDGEGNPGTQRDGLALAIYTTLNRRRFAEKCLLQFTTNQYEIHA